VDQFDEATENEEVEKDIIDYLKVEDEDSAEEEIDTETDDLDELKDRISKRNKTLKKSKQAQKRMQQEIDDLKGIVDKFRDDRESAPNKEAQQQEYKETLEKWRESVRDEPEKALDYAEARIGQMQDQMVDFLAKQQASLESRFGEIDGKLDPERAKYRDKINALRTNPDFEGMDDETLLKFAKALDTRIPRGTIGGRPAKVEATEEQRLEKLKEQYRKQFNNGM